MAYRTYLGIEVADPAAGTEGCSVETMGEGATMVMANGSIVYDYSEATRFRWTLHWVGVTAAQWTVLKTRAAVKTAQSFSPPDEDDGGSAFYTVYVVPNSLRYTSFEHGTAIPRFDVDLQVETTTG